MSDSADKTDELYPIAVLIDELKVRFACSVARGSFHMGNVSNNKISTTMFSYD